MSVILTIFVGYMSTHVVIMAGGVGSRFWPLSTPVFPKQFIDILGCGRSLIQLTMDRFEGICPAEHFWVVTNAAYVPMVKEQLPMLPAHHILAEPASRNTAPCIAWACWNIMHEDPDADVVVTPSDAVVMDTAAFRGAIGRSLNFAGSSDAIVTIGIKPSRPETGYGYIKAGPESGAEILEVSSFKEKPTLEVAERYLADGGYLWNAGIFVWRASTIVSCLERYAPDIASLMDRIMSEDAAQTLFPQARKISIDYAVMEPAAADGLVRVCPADFGWSDLGNWASLHDRLPKDGNANAAVGTALTLVDCRDCLVHAEDASRVVIQGLEGYVVALKDGRLLVCRRSEEQKIREWSQS